MNKNDLKIIIDNAFENISNVNIDTKGEIKEAVEDTLNLLDQGLLRVAESLGSSKWKVNQWVKKAVLLSFRLNDLNIIQGGPESWDCGPSVWWDKIKSKFSNWSADDFKKSGFRAVPGSIVRYSAFIGKNVVLMPSFVNLGAFVDEGAMIDTWATVGSCAQIGKNVHLSGGAGIGGVLEPLQSNPVIIEDNCFIGARSEVAEGVIVEEGSVLSMGVYIGASTKIIDRSSGEIFMGRVPSYSVVVPGSTSRDIKTTKNSPSLYCAVIVKRVDAKTRSKTSINDLLRD